MVAIQDDALTLLNIIAEANDGSSAPVFLEDVSVLLPMDLEHAKAAFRYLESKGLIETFSMAYSARPSAAGLDLLSARVIRPAKHSSSQAPPSSKQGEIIMLKPNFYGFGLDLNELMRRIGRWLGRSSTPQRALVLIPDEAQSFVHHAPQQDGRKVTQIAVRGWATNTTGTPLYPTLVRLSRPFGARVTSNFIVTQGARNMFSRDNPVQPGERRQVSAHFFVEGFIGRPRVRTH